LLGKIMQAYDALPPRMRSPLAEDNTGSKVFAIRMKDDKGRTALGGLNSKIEAIATGGGASKTVTVNIRDEAALVDDKVASVTHKQTMPTLTTTNGWCFIISTAEGAWGWFYNMYWGAKRGDNEFKAHFLPWDSRPDRDAPWYEREKRKYSNEDDFFNQYPSSDVEAFLVSGRTAFSRKAIDALRKDQFEPKRLFPPVLGRVRGYMGGSIKVEFHPDSLDGFVEVWRKPERNTRYVIGVDIAEGKMVNPDAPNSQRSDYSVAAVMCLDTNEYVARIKTRELPPNEFALQVSLLGLYYNNALVIPEINSGYGFAFMQTLKTLYQHIYFREVTADHIGQRITREFGFLSSGNTRGVWINALGVLIKDSAADPMEKIYPENPPMILHGTDTINDLSKFIVNDRGRAEAAPGEHDDEVVALGLCAVVVMSTSWGKFNYTPEAREEKQPMSFLEEFEQYEIREQIKYLDSLDKKPYNSNRRALHKPHKARQRFIGHAR